MATNDSLQRYIDAGIAFTNMTRKKAEELVSELVQNGDLQRGDAKARVDDLLERSRQGTEVIVSTVRSEVSRQLGAVGIANLEDLANQVAVLLGRTDKATAKKTTAKKGAAKKTAATKAPATKSAGTKTAAKKTAATKTAAKKTAAKKAAAKKASAANAPVVDVAPVESEAPGTVQGSAD
ncbi:MAG: histone H1-like repetitive region-containing protein [Acidimicrobiales bacterium]|jgi:polyhydroxyalkanoate synthesis regulator phasin